MRTALVTGATRGIGRAISFRLAEKGYGLTIAARSADALSDLADELTAVGARGVVHIETNVGKRETIDDLVRRHDEAYGAMHALILNAGTGSTGAAAEVDLKSYDRMIEVNLTSAVLLVRSAMPLLRRGAESDARRGARVIALSSLTGTYPEAGLSTYGATKAALNSFIETLNLENADFGVLANSIAPGYVDTDMAAWVTDRIPRESMIPVADVVAVVELLTELSRNTSVGRILLSRASSSGFMA